MLSLLGLSVFDRLCAPKKRRESFQIHVLGLGYLGISAGWLILGYNAKSKFDFTEFEHDNIYSWFLFLSIDNTHLFFNTFPVWRKLTL